ncbi:MAG TPA: biotin transporter BioY [Tepidimicrobium sp.]|nr:biotin transporter BioY [Tepidimicrobium sp.]
MKLSIREMILISLFTALTAIGAFISIPIGDVPITLQSMFSLLAGLLLGPKLGALSQLVYVLLGLSGIRIFAGFSGGPQTIFKPSFGFLIGFIFAALIVGKFIHDGKLTGLKGIVLTAFLGTFVIYLFGISHMYIILNKMMDKAISLSATIKMGCLIFLPGDILKAILTSFIAFKVLERLKTDRI